MEGLLVTLAPAALTVLLLQLVKWIWRKYIVKNEDYDFPPDFYKVAIPVLNILLLPVAAFLDPNNNVMPTDWVGFARAVLVVLINSVSTLVLYNAGYKPAVEYGRVYKMLRK